MITIKFVNPDALGPDNHIVTRLMDADDIVRWYAAFHAGDKYKVYIDGVEQKLDQNGELE